MTDAALLSVEGLRIETVRDGAAFALVDDVSFRLRRGQVLALVGESGSGKSLTCLGLQGLLPPGVRLAKGTLRLNDKVVDLARTPGRIVATIMQAPRSAFNPVLTMRAHVRETLRARGAWPADAKDLIADAFESVGLPVGTGVLDLYPFQMSGGMLQRAMLALAVLTRAPFLIADEPTTDLDLVVQVQILALLERLVVDRKMGILLVTHDLSVVARLSDEIAVMDCGRIVEHGSPASIFQSSRHPRTRDLLQAHFSLYTGRSSAGAP